MPLFLLQNLQIKIKYLFFYFLNLKCQTDLMLIKEPLSLVL